MPAGYGYEWAGEAREEVSSGSTSAIAFVFGLLFVFLILAAQYESWSLPVGVMMAVPFAILGALVAIALRGIPNDLYFQIGLLTLIGLAAKNAILIVEFAVELNRKEGKSFFDAAVEAARLRLRPIVMTSFAFMLGTVPLAIATGASANSRHSIGTGVIGGTLVATVIAIFFIPMFYWLLETSSAKLLRRARTRPRRVAATARRAKAVPTAPVDAPQQGRLTMRTIACSPLRSAACVAGCMVGPDYLRPDVATPPAYRIRAEGGGATRQRRVVEAVRRPGARPPDRRRARRTTGT